MDYKKILEGVVNIINTTEKSDIGFANICTYIGENCPELSESEDERIRKAIIEHFKWSTKQILYDYSNKKALTWLVKQGKQKPVDEVKPKFKVGDKIYLKPEYRMPDDDTPIANTVFEIRAIDDKHYRFDGSYIFIEDQDKYELVEQKPAWSEEDAKILDGVITNYESGYLPSVEKRDEIIEKLKSLRPQSQWKPSEEQMNALNDVISSRDIKYDILSELWKDLKKLREE